MSPQQRELLARLLDAEGVAETRPPVAHREPGAPVELSAGQQRLYFLDRLRPGDAAYTVAGAIRFRGGLDPAALRAAVQHVVDRHEALRTGFAEQPDGGVLQVVSPAEDVAIDVTETGVATAEVDTRVRELVAVPFDLSKPPLLRAALLRITDGAGPQWLLVLCLHHIVVDGWSLGLLAEELGLAYDALSEGRTPDLPRLTSQYPDFAQVQQVLLSDELVSDQLTYWSERLAGAAPADLPTRRPRPAMPSGRSAVVPLEVPAPLTSALTSAAVAARASLFMVLLTGFGVLLGRWSGGSDVVVGAPVAGRPHGGFDRVVGFFVNVLPLRVTYAPREPVRELLARVREVCAGGYAHQDVPFDRIVEALDTPRDPNGQSALVRHALTLNDTGPLAARLGGAEVTAETVHTGHAKFELEVQLHPHEGGLAGWIEYETDLFDRATVERMAEGFLALLTAIAEDDGTPVGALAVPAGAELDRLRGLSGSGAGPLTGPTLPHWFEAQVDATPAATAVIADGTGAELSYAELDARANRIARGLLDRGVAAEDRVGVCLERGPDLIATILAVLKVGAAYLPLDPGYPAPRLAGMVADARPSLIVTEGGFDEHGDMRVSPEGLAAHAAERPGVPIPASGAAYVLFTSGSTGRPKGAVNTHEAIVNRLRWMQRRCRIGPDDRVLQKTPIGFDVSVWELLWPLMTGSTLVFARPDGHRDPGYLHEVIQRRLISTCHFVPSMLQAFVDHGGEHPTLRTVICSGEELPPALADRMVRAHPGAALHNLYGPTEAAIDVTAHLVSRPVAGRVPIGRPITGAEVYVLDPGHRPVPLGVPGELFIGGVQLARGYIGKPGLTAERFIPHPLTPGARLYATGDRARFLPSGELEFLGRLDNQVKVRGNRIEPAEIETALTSHPEVTAALVTPHPADGGILLLGYAVAPEATEDMTHVLRGFLRERLPEYMVPNHLFTLPAWPTGPNGKLDRSALPVPGTRAAGAARVAPRDDHERAILGIWVDLLGVDGFGVTDSFFDLGGHSLLASRLLARIRSDFTVEVALAAFFAAPTVRALGQLVAAGAPPTLPPLRPVDRERYRIRGEGEGR